MKKILIALIFPFLLFAGGCKKEIQTAGNNRSHLKPKKIKKIKKLNYPYRLALENQWNACLNDPNLESEKINELRSKIEDFQQNFIDKKIDCSSNSTAKECKYIKGLTFNVITKNSKTESKTSGNIMLLDSILMSALETTLMMKKRSFIGYYKFKDGKFTKSDYRYKMQKKLFDFYNLYGNHPSPLPLNTFCSNDEFQKLFSYEEIDLSEESSHGNTVLNLLLDMAIERKIVLVNDGVSGGILSDVLAKSCSYTRIDKLKLKSILTKNLKKAARSITKIIDENNIRFINNSSGITSDIIMDTFDKKSCLWSLSREKANLINKLYSKYYLKTIYQYKNTIVFQASPNKIKRNMEKSKNYYSDCNYYKNRISINSFSQEKFQDIIPAEGSTDKTLLRNRVRSYNCSDININSFDPTNSKHPFGIGLNGESYYGRYGTSFATPLALAFFSQKEIEYIKIHDKVPTRDELVDYVTGYDEDRNIFDPLSYMDFSTCKKYPAYCNSHIELFEKYKR